MIRQLIFVRHGESEANADGVYAGSRSEIKLTKQGREQARAAGRLLTHDHVTTIIASDFDRALETARIIAGEIGFDPAEIELDLRLREINVGRLTGQSDIGFVKLLDYLESGADDSAEPIEDLTYRATSFLRDLAFHPGEVVLVVAHAGIARVLRAIATDTDLHEVAKLEVPNAQPLHVPAPLLKELQS